MRTIVLASILIVASACAASTAARPAGPRWLQIDAPMLELLDLVHGAFENEVAICLAGDIRGETLRVTRLGATRILSAPSPDSVRHRGCDRSEFLGVYHNHPGDHPCTLSPMDIRTARTYRHAIDVVSCGDGMFAWRMERAEGVLSKFR